MILVQGGCAHTLQFTARQGWFEHIRGVQRPLGCARADHGVQFVDEQDDLALSALDILDGGFQPFLEFTPEA